MGDKVYAVYHCWEVDYYNATRWEEELICVFDTLEKAVVWYKDGVLKIVEMPTTYDETKFWWLKGRK